MVHKIFMVKWKLVKNQKKDFNWDEKLLSFSESNFYQSESWGKHKSNFNWKVYRFVAYDQNDNIKSMAQCLVRFYPYNSCIISCPGGPIGDLKLFDRSFIDYLARLLGKKYIYFRMRSMREYNTETIEILAANGWRIPKNKLTSNLTLLLNLEQKESDLINNLSKNWRRNLKRYKYDSLSIVQWPNPDINKILLLFSEMESYKSIKIGYTKDELKSLLQNFAKELIIFRCEINNKLIAIRAAIINTNKAWDLLAATNSIARKNYVSHQILWRLLMECKKIGVKNYDFSGIDPKNNPGVYNFKKGTGAINFASLGELEWCNSNILRYFINLIIRFRNRSI